MNYTTLQEIEDAREMISPPGDTLAETLEYRGISQTDLARRMGRPLKTINEIVNGKVAIMPETAIQLEHATGIPASFWLERERKYRLELAEIDNAEQILKNKEWVNNFPLAAMKKLSWIDYGNNVISKTNAIFTYFRVANIEAYYNYYNKHQYSTAFKMSSANNKNPYSIAAWLRQGECQAENINVAPYNREGFKEALANIKLLMQRQPIPDINELKQICESIGVKLIQTPPLKGGQIDGATRWINDIPLIQLSGSYKQNRHFWFTFFHEAGHIIRHGKKDFFVEGLTYNSDEQIKENEANEFANMFLSQ